MRTSVLQGEDSRKEGGGRTGGGIPGQRPLRGEAGCPDKEMARIPRAVALERKMKNENKK